MTPADLERLRELVLQGDPLAISALERWQRWKDTPREKKSVKRHHRRAFERAAEQALQAATGSASTR